MTPEEKLNKYYLKKFGWTLAEVNSLSERQGHVCAICRRPPGERRLSLDHDHAYDRVKIAIQKFGTMWEAVAASKELGFYRNAVMPTRKLAKEILKRQLRRLSVRGLLCLRCNKGIQMFEDSKAPLSPAERFDNAAKYFRDFHQKAGSHEVPSP